MEVDTCDQFADLLVTEGEEHVADVLGPEVGSLGSELATDSCVPGRLRGRHKEYEKLGAEPYIVESELYSAVFFFHFSELFLIVFKFAAIRDGFKLVFQSEPPPSYLRNNRSALDRPDFVRKELARLEGLGCIKRVDHQPKIVNPISVVYSNKWRLVLDGSRGLNPFCERRGVKLEDLSHVARTVSKGDWMVCNDHDSGYWHVPVSEEHWTYLGVHVVAEDGSVQYYVWMVLVLGLRDAAHIYTRINRPIMAALRREGIKGLLYIDDDLTVAKSKQKCLEAERRTYEVFQDCGWIFKPSKRSGEPAQTCKFLGLIIDSRDLTFNIPDYKIQDIKSLIAELRARTRVKVKLVARLVGKLQAVRLATGPIVAILTRSLYVAVATAKSWKSWLEFTEMAQFELRWWQENLQLVAKFPIDGKLSTEPVSYEVASDASGIGHYVYLVGSSNTRLASRAFSAEERLQSSTWRELKAVHEVWTDPVMLKRFSGSRISHYTDNKAVAGIIAKGSRNPRLQPLVVQTVLALRGAGIVLEAVWRSREDGMIKLADLGSRDFNKDDISLDFETMSQVLDFRFVKIGFVSGFGFPVFETLYFLTLTVFMQLFEEFGQFDIDCFASSSNTKAKRFFSRLDSPGSAGMDFFHQR